jgi:hypothetical protein
MTILPNPHLPAAGRMLQREEFLTVLKAALQLKENRFARQAALAWLAAFPGDLPVNRYYAELLLDEGHPEGALPILNKICQADPEYREAVEAKLQAEQKLKARLPEMKGRLTRVHRELSIHTAADTMSWLIALGGSPFPQVRDGRIAAARETTMAVWCRHLKQARQVLEKGDPAQAESCLHQALVAEPTTPLVAATHMRILLHDKGMPLQSRISLAEYYRQRWPDCLHCQLVLADALMDSGEDEQAVSLLHQAVTADITGQVAFRLWGQSHPYRSLWPAPLVIQLDVPVPSSVSAALGWNRLPSGYTQPALDSLSIAMASRTRASGASPQTPVQKPDFIRPVFEAALPGEASAKNGAGEGQPVSPADDRLPPQISSPAQDAAVPETLRSVQAELDKIAERLNRSGLTRRDGRFPVYIILTCRSGLQKTYGESALPGLEADMLRLASAVRARRRWDALLFYADEGRAVTGGPREITVQEARPNDPWSIKLALVDLDAALAQRGEMVGAVLIVGGPEVVPFHLLPNPVDDADIDVPSDNPYGTRDENYFIPEWPVGRLPGGDPQAGGLQVSATGQAPASSEVGLSICGSPDFLGCTLRSLSARQEQLARRDPWRLRFLERAWLWLRRSKTIGRRAQPSFGYTAAIWKHASLTVFRPIGESHAMFVSPPVQAKPANGRLEGTPDGREGASPSRGKKRKLKALVLPDARLGYFNLHGLEDAVEWYGQRDPADTGDGPDYPVALRPEDVPNSGKAPEVIFSEACYGAHILGRAVEEAMALKFLQSGAQAVVGCTSTAYGSIQAPLIAADFLGHAFWNYLQEGAPAGEALRRAKISLAREMHNRQGYLDGEDQKTLISFVLYGDPLAQPVVSGKGPKAIVRQVKPPLMVKTVCDRASEADSAQPVPSEMLVYVKKIVEQYLPGMEDASLTWSHEHAECHEHSHECPTGQLAKASVPYRIASGQSYRPGRSVITLSKQKRVSNGASIQHLHRHYARLTLDENGKLVKLVVSR